MEKITFKDLNLKYEEIAMKYLCDAEAFMRVGNTEVVILGPKGDNLHGIDEFVDAMSPSGSRTTARRASVVSGKEWEGKVEKEFLIVFFTDVRRNDKNKMEYKFLNNSDGICSAKSPMGMFNDQFIDNDLQSVITKIQEYYK